MTPFAKLWWCLTMNFMMVDLPAPGLPLNQRRPLPRCCQVRYLGCSRIHEQVSIASSVASSRSRYISSMYRERKAFSYSCVICCILLITISQYLLAINIIFAGTEHTLRCLRSCPCSLSQPVYHISILLIVPRRIPLQKTVLFVMADLDRRVDNTNSLFTTYKMSKIVS
ncbi:hypothetical protein BDV97DRAFT_105083 [Delphinella strobiligena]|nr:hypothetical protein BDV97DRAFT_105083 [Delphinella strobiligena]